MNRTESLATTSTLPPLCERDLHLADSVRWACVLEASARKVGNVHPGASFPNLTYSDFVRSAEAASPIIAQAAKLGIGCTVFEAVEATRAVVTTNTNLGIVLLLVPLAAAPENKTLADGIGDVLKELTHNDAVWVYRAIRLAQPGGLGTVRENDVADEPTGTLLEVMRFAADRDGVAAQYANDFDWVLHDGVASLRQATQFPTQWEESILRLQLELLARHPDTLIARKCGIDVAIEAARRANHILKEANSSPLLIRESVREFDRWLRADGNRRNPGTTADLVTACLFAALRDGVITPPAADPAKFSAERLAAARTGPPTT